LAAANKKACYIVGIFPVSPNYKKKSPVSQALYSVTDKLKKESSGLTGIYVIDFGNIQEYYRLSRIFDPFKDREGHMPFSNECYAAIGKCISRFL
jgi:hypothetical protein